jgi:hypothetical protein
MKAKPEQDLSLLPGEYYHPDAVLKVEYYPDDTLMRRGHFLKRKPHGVWKYYEPNGKISQKGHWFEGKEYGVWEWYREDGTIRELIFWQPKSPIPFFGFMETLLNTRILKL